MINVLVVQRHLLVALALVAPQQHLHAASSNFPDSFPQQALPSSQNQTAPYIRLSVITFWIPACLIPVHASLRTLYSTPGRSSIGSADPDLDPIPRHFGAQCIIQSEL